MNKWKYYIYTLNATECEDTSIIERIIEQYEYDGYKFVSWAFITPLLGKLLFKKKKIL